jgi:hypothetical protein
MGLVLVGGVVAPVVTPTGPNTASAASRAVLPFDFDGDGYADLAVGVSGEDLRGVKDAGAVQVLYGSAAGVTARDQLWRQGRKGIKNKLEKNDRFGEALASGDFNADGYADLAIGIPWEGIGSIRKAGAVQVLYGSPVGLTASGDQVWHQGKSGVPGSNSRHDRFGKAVAVGDFDGDGYPDLAVGVPGEDWGSINSAGRVVILRGSAGGLTSAGAQSWSEGSAGIASAPAESEYFGERLAAGDVNGDGRDDLAVGVRDESRGQSMYSAVHLLLGGSRGLRASGSQRFYLADIGLDRTPFLVSLWLGDVNADGRDDLVVGSPRGVAVLHGHPDGLHLRPLGAPSGPGRDGIWSAYAGPAVSGDLTGDGRVDLAMRAPGGVAVVTGMAQGLGSDVVLWRLDGVPLAGVDSIYPVEAEVLNVLPLSGGSHAWLVVGSGDSYVDTIPFAGAAIVLQGTQAGTAGPATVWHQDSPGIKGHDEFADHFGHSVGGTSPSGL